jgi:hypothetical protein
MVLKWKFLIPLLYFNYKDKKNHKRCWGGVMAYSRIPGKLLEAQGTKDILKSLVKDKLGDAFAKGVGAVQKSALAADHSPLGDFLGEACGAARHLGQHGVNRSTLAKAGSAMVKGYDAFSGLSEVKKDADEAAFKSLQTLTSKGVAKAGDWMANKSNVGSGAASPGSSFFQNIAEPMMQRGMKGKY